MAGEEVVGVVVCWSFRVDESGCSVSDGVWVFRLEMGYDDGIDFATWLKMVMEMVKPCIVSW